MAYSPDQHHQNSSMAVTPGNISRVHSDTSVLSTASFQSIPDSIPEVSLSPPQISNLMATPISMPNSPHLSSRPSSSKGKGGMKKKFQMRKTTPTQPGMAISPLSHPPPPVPEDSLTHVSVHQANKALFTRMLKRAPKKISFRRTKRRMDKQYHSDDGYTSDPGILREEDDDETDNDPDVPEMRRLTQIKDLQTKIEKAKRSIDIEEPPIADSEDYIDGPAEKHNNRLGLLLHRNTGKSKYLDQRRRKIEKLEAQLKDLQEGGTLDDASRRLKLKGRIEDSLKGITHRRFIRGLTNAGIKFRRKRTSAPGDEVIDDEDDEQLLEEDDLAATPEEGLLEVTAEPEEILVDDLRVEQAALRLSTDNCEQEIRQLKEQLIQHEESMRLIVEKLDQERERGDRLEGQLNDITELHQHEMSNLQAQLGQIESSAMVKSQELEEAVELFNSKFDKVDAHVMTLMDSSDAPDVKQRLMRAPTASLLSFLLVMLAFIFKVVSIVRSKPLSHLSVAVVLSVLIGLWWYGYIYWPHLQSTSLAASPTETPPIETQLPNAPALTQ